jgi:serine/threonine protein phosphatase PrpC
MIDKSIRWRVVAASMRGTSHEKQNLPCQDAFEWQVAKKEWFVAAVADGAGSAALADVGAKRAVRTAVDETIKTINNGLRHRSLPQSKDAWCLLLVKILQTTKDDVIATAKKEQRQPRELASTLILVVLGPNITIAAQIGDGASIQRKNEDIQILTRPASTEYVNETTFLVSPSAVETAQLVIEDASSNSIAVLSDGLQTMALEYPNWNPFLPFFKPVFDFVEKRKDEKAATLELESFLKSDRVRNHSDDDITLLLATREISPSKTGTVKKWLSSKIQTAKS